MSQFDYDYGNPEAHVELSLEDAEAFFLDQDYATAQGMALNMLDICKEYNLDLIADVYHLLGKCYGFMGTMPDATDAFNHAIRHYREQGKQEELAYLYIDYASMFVQKKRLSFAEKWLRKAYDFAHELEDPELMALSTMTLALQLEVMERTEESAQLFAKAEELYIQLGDYTALFKVYLQRATSAQVNDDYATAEQYFQKIHEFEHTISPIFRSQLYYEHGRLKMVQGQLDTAADYAQQGLELADEAPQHWNTIASMLTIIQIDRGEFSAAQALIDQVRQRIKQTSDPAMEAEALGYQMLIALYTQPEMMPKHLKALTQLINEHGFEEILIADYLMLAAHLHKLNQTAEARIYVQKARETAQSVGLMQSFEFFVDQLIDRYTINLEQI